MIFLASLGMTSLKDDILKGEVAAMPQPLLVFKKLLSSRTPKG